ncbi:LuxR C-terminal-related transcriptional regulator [Streptomyces sp. NBRC 109706]|uniref:LuxR C-terminal-related transcriptional regulator n=1 Tax=Streptomyces sp. NBRC 109706 TaxID=1550035 RepID=UPI000783DB8A|nr:LuxR C-terminal-related transcriptional regulator [Streptomyces sp. NBRC 109706]
MDTEGHPIPELPELDRISSLAYRFALEHGYFTRQSLVAKLDLTESQAEHSVHTLRALRLVRPVDDVSDQLVPVSPEAAAAQLVTPIESEIQQLRRLADRLRSDFAALMPLYFEQRRRRRSEEAVDVLEDAETVGSVLAYLAAECRQEVLTVQPGGGRPAEVLSEASSRDLALLERGVRLRILYQHTVRFHAPTQSYVAEVQQAGAQVRTLDELFSRMQVFDREIALLPSQHSGTEAVLTREPSIVLTLCNAFEQLWEQATPFAEQLPGADEFDDAKRAILQMLVAGVKDEVIARRMGFSVRTCRRHIAEIMQVLDADSRFQAGYILSRQQR